MDAHDADLALTSEHIYLSSLRGRLAGSGADVALYWEEGHHRQFDMNSAGVEVGLTLISQYWRLCFLYQISMPIQVFYNHFN